MEVRVHLEEGSLQQVIDIGPYRLLTDAPAAYGGDASGPEPHDLLAASLGTCTAITVAMYTRRKNVDLQDIDVRVEHPQQDSAYLFERRITHVDKLSAEDRERLTEIANKCPVHKTLSRQIRIVTEAH